MWPGTFRPEDTGGEDGRRRTAEEAGGEEGIGAAMTFREVLADGPTGGRKLVVTAELSPPGEAPVTRGAVPEALAVLARRGLVTLAPERNAKKTPYPELAPALRPGRVAELLDDERGQS